MCGPLSYVPTRRSEGPICGRSGPIYGRSSPIRGRSRLVALRSVLPGAAAIDQAFGVRRRLLLVSPEMGAGLEELGITDDGDEDASNAASSASDRPLIGKQPEVAPELPRPIPEVLESISLFAGLLPVHLARISRLAKVVDYPKNAYVFKHGDEGDGLYVVLDGAVRISRNAAGIGEEALAILRNGAPFGEMSIIDDDATRSADAIVHETARLLLLPKHDLRDLMFVDRELAYELLWRFIRTLTSRLRDSNDRLMMLSLSSRF